MKGCKAPSALSSSPQLPSQGGTIPRQGPHLDPHPASPSQGILEGDISRLIIYNWNRRYPFDRQLDISPAKMGFKLVSVTEFEGSSHEKITKEIYER